MLALIPHFAFRIPHFSGVRRLGPRAHLGLAFIGYLAVRWFVLGGMAPVWFSDTQLYAAQYHGGFAGGFFGLARSWGYPFFLWLTGYHWGLAVAVQRLAAGAAWFALAAAAAGLFRTPWVRRGVFAAMLLVSLNLYAVMWDVMLLSESLAIACLVVFAAAWLRFLRAPGLGLRWLGAMALLAAPLAGLRDSNAPLLLFFALAAAIAALCRALRPGAQKPTRPALAGGLALCGVMALTALFHHHDALAGHRSWANIGNVLSVRVFAKQGFAGSGTVADLEKIDWLARHYGLPTPEAMARVGRLVTQEPPLSPRYRAWLEATGPRAWSGFLLRHPVWVLALYSNEAVYEAQPLDYLDVEGEKWRAAHLGLPFAVRGLTHFFCGPLLGLRIFNILLALAAAAAGAAWVGAMLGWRMARGTAAWLGAFFWLTAASVLAALVAMVGDGIEVWRHAILGLMTLYAAIPLAAGAAGELAWRGARQFNVLRAAKQVSTPRQQRETRPGNSKK